MTIQEPGRPRGDGGVPPRGATTRRSARGRKAVPRRLDESMTLLREVMERPLDPGYATAAERRRSGAPTRGRALTVVLAVLCGLLVTWSVVVLRAPAPEAVKSRQILLEQVRARTKANEAAKQRIAADQAAVRRAQDRALAAVGDPQAAATAQTLGIIAGDVPVTGPGLRISLDDAPGSRDGGGANADPRGASSDSDGRVYDRDLQTIVNGLWDAGAEAIAVNGERLTSLSAIRSAGEAILVDYRPLSPPYRLEAVGDPQSMQTAFAAAPAGAYLQSLQDNFGVKAGIEVEQRLDLPGSGTLTLHRASPALPSAGTSRSKSPEATP